MLCPSLNPIYHISFLLLNLVAGTGTIAMTLRLAGVKMEVLCNLISARAKIRR